MSKNKKLVLHVRTFKKKKQGKKRKQEKLPIVKSKNIKESRTLILRTKTFVLKLIPIIATELLTILVDKFIG